MKKIAVLVLTVSLFSIAASAQGIAKLANWEAKQIMNEKKAVSVSKAVEKASNKQAALAISASASETLLQIKKENPALAQELDRVIALHDRFIELGKMTAEERSPRAVEQGANFIVQELYIKTVDSMYPLLYKMYDKDQEVTSKVTSALNHYYWVEVEGQAYESWTSFIGLGHKYFQNLPNDERQRIEKLASTK